MSERRTRRYGLGVTVLNGCGRAGLCGGEGPPRIAPIVRRRSRFQTSRGRVCPSYTIFSDRCVVSPPFTESFFRTDRRWMSVFETNRSRTRRPFTPDVGGLMSMGGWGGGSPAARPGDRAGRRVSLITLNLVVVNFILCIKMQSCVKFVQSL